MDEMEDISFEEFESAFAGDGNQTGIDTETENSAEADSETMEPESEAASEADAEDPADAEQDGSDGENASAEDTSAAQDANGDQKFTLKVNKEERQVSLEEMTAFAQKGMDYDRVKDQNAQLRQTNTELQEKVDGMAANQGVMDIIGMIAQKSGSTVEQIAEMLYVNFRKSAGASEDAAREELKSAKLEKELNAIKTQQSKPAQQESDAEERARRDIEAFSQEYPDVELTKELVSKLTPDIQRGMSLSSAYRKYEKAQDAAKIAELERKLAANSQNEKNRKKSPGSQQDSGGRQAADEFDKFLSAFQ